MFQYLLWLSLPIASKFQVTQLVPQVEQELLTFWTIWFYLYFHIISFPSRATDLTFIFIGSCLSFSFLCSVVWMVLVFHFCYFAMVLFVLLLNNFYMTLWYLWNLLFSLPTIWVEGNQRGKSSNFFIYTRFS